SIPPALFKVPEDAKLTAIVLLARSVTNELTAILVVAIVVGPPFRLRTLNPPKVLEKVRFAPGDVMLIVAPVVDRTAVAPASDSSGVLRNTASEETVTLFSVRRCPATKLKPPVVTLPATVKSCPELMVIDPPAVATPVALVSGFNCPAAAPTVMSA